MTKPKTKNLGKCLVSGCKLPARTLEMCNTHVMQYRRGVRDLSGALLRPLKEAAKGRACKVAECDRKVVGKGFCQKHWQQHHVGKRAYDGTPALDLTERNVGPRNLSPVARRAKKLRDGVCDLCPNPMFHGETGFCTMHYARLRAGVIDCNGVELRPLAKISAYPEGALCLVPNCGQRPCNRWMCSLHARQREGGILDEVGNQLRQPKNGGRLRRKHRWGPVRGYWKIHVPGHPNADQYGMVLEHRLAMEQHLGRLLEKQEVVHHLNGDRADNRIENLQLRSSKKDHGHGHERIADTQAALELLDKLVNQQMSDAESTREQLKLLLQRLDPSRSPPVASSTPSSIPLTTRA